MGRRRLTIAFVAVLFCASIGCSERKTIELTPRKSIPVSGVVHLNGQAAGMVQVKLHRKRTDGAATNPVAAVTDPEGNFQAEIPYLNNELVPVGDYYLTFRRLTQFKPPVDELLGKYANPANSEQIVTVAAEGESFNVGTVELETP